MSEKSIRKCGVINQAILLKSISPFWLRSGSVTTVNSQKKEYPLYPLYVSASNVNEVISFDPYKDNLVSRGIFNTSFTVTLFAIITPYCLKGISLVCLLLLQKPLVFLFRSYRIYIYSYCHCHLFYLVLFRHS